MGETLALIRYESWAAHVVLWLPVAGMLLVLAAPGRWPRSLALGTATLDFLLSLPLWTVYLPGDAGFRLTTSLPWIPPWGVSYSLGIDGISLFLVLLTTFLTPVAMLGSFGYIRTREKAFYAMMLMLETGILGAFIALDLFLFFVFWEILLIPMYFIIGIWGGERRTYAAIKFFVYTGLGSLLMLVAILFLALKHQSITGEPSFAYADLLRLPLSDREQYLLFVAFALAFAVKLPLFPFHTWLPDAHVEAPTPGSVILAAILLKLGGYGFLRFLLPLFPAAATDPTVVGVLLALGLAGIVYTAWVASAQPDAKKMVAYTSVAHMGFVVLGIFAFTVEGTLGAIVVMLSHGVSTGAMFLLVGMLYERRHTRLIADFGGLAGVMPLFATVFVVTALTSIGLPGTSGFTGEFLSLLGTFLTQPRVAVIATAGVILAACYMLPMVQKILFNPLDRGENRVLPDLTVREGMVLAPLVAVMIWIGIYPKPILARVEPSVTALIRTFQDRAGEPQTFSTSFSYPPHDLSAIVFEDAGCAGCLGPSGDEAARAAGRCRMLREPLRAEARDVVRSETAQPGNTAIDVARTLAAPGADSSSTTTIAGMRDVRRTSFRRHQDGSRRA